MKHLRRTFAVAAVGWMTAVLLAQTAEVPAGEVPGQVQTADPLYACKQLMTDPAVVEKAEHACGDAAKQADSYPAGTHFTERRAAYVFDAEALLRAHKKSEAETVARKAVAVVKEGHDDESGKSAAYAVLGNAQALLGKLEAADVNLKTAETYERSELSSEAGQSQAAKFTAILKQILLFHADVLERMGKKEEANAKRAEAAKL
jgi:hypothetical protein